MCCFKSLFKCISKPKKSKDHKNGKPPKHCGTKGPSTTSTPGFKQDPVDKAVSSMLGNRVNPETVEKITDGARGMFEKKTGHKVPGFISN